MNLHLITKKKVAIAILIAAALGDVALHLRPKPLSRYIPADCLGYFEVQDASQVIHLLRDQDFLQRTFNRENVAGIKNWIDFNLQHLSLTPRHLSTLQAAVVFSSASAEVDHTIKIHGALLLRVRSFWVRRLDKSPRSLAEQFFGPNAFVSTESLRGEQVAVITLSKQGQVVFLAVHRDCILLSNEREALASILATLDGTQPSISNSPAWRDAAPQILNTSLVRGFFRGPAVFNLFCEFLSKNYAAFDDAARTSRFLASLGLNQIRSLTYNARWLSGAVNESWHFHVNPGLAYAGSLLALFVNQEGSALGPGSLDWLPSNGTSAQLITISKTKEMWNSFVGSVGILTNQEAPENRNLTISVLEGALGFRIERDLLDNLQSPLVFLQVSTPDPQTQPRADARLDGWIFAAKSKNRAALESVFAKIIAEDRTPSRLHWDDFTLYYSTPGRTTSKAVSAFMEGFPAYATRDDVIYFSPDKELLLSSLHTLDTTRPTTHFTLPNQMNPRAPYLSLTPVFEEPDSDLRRQGFPPEASARGFSNSEITPSPDGFDFHRISSRGFVCDLIREVIEAGQ